MQIESSFRRFMVASSLAGSLALLAGCGQQAPVEDLALAGTSEALTQEQVLPTGGVCSPTGAHGRHATTSCTACHECGGVLQFGATGPAVAAGQPLPTFDATNKTCSSVACHSVPAGTYTYTVWDYSIDEGYAVSVPYGGGAAQTTPSWYATGGGSSCAACHPLPASPYNWHSGYHGGSTTTNSCQTCHPDAVGVTGPGGVVTGVALSTATNCGPQRNQPCAALHANGVLNVTPTWGNSCFGCH